MRIGELALAGGVPLPTVAYYLRERLLPAGVPTGHNRADYGAAHVDRLKLVRALIEIGGLSVAAVHEVLAAAGDPGTGPRELLVLVQDAADRPGGRGAGGKPQDVRRARVRLAEAVEAHGWKVEPDSAALDLAAQALAAFDSFDAGCLAELVGEYAEAADRVARSEVAALAKLAGTDGPDGIPGPVTGPGPSAGPPGPSSREQMVLGAVVGEALFAALRRLARQNAAARLGRPDPVVRRAPAKPGARTRARAGSPGTALLKPAKDGA